jgi:hypothetical protein
LAEGYDNQNCVGNATVIPKKFVADMKKGGEKLFLRRWSVIDEDNFIWPSLPWAC